MMTGVRTIQAQADAEADAARHVVATSRTFADPPERVWDAVLFYEELERRPPWHLRLMLPVPVRTEGKGKGVGDQVRCVYEGGHLIKQITESDGPRRYAFDVVEQALKVGGGVRLLGGSYALEALPEGGTRVTLTTRYRGARRPRWLWRPFESKACGALHRYLLRELAASMTASEVG